MSLKEFLEMLAIYLGVAALYAIGGLILVSL